MALLNADANLSGDSSLIGGAESSYSASSSLTGEGALSGTCFLYLPASASLSGSSDIVASPNYAVSASLEGGSDVVSGPVEKYAAQATLQGSSSVSAQASVTVGYPAPVLYTAAPRVVPANRMILDPVDLFLSDGKTRSQDVVPSQLQLKVFHNATELNWSLVSGVGITDPRIVSGKIYWTEFSAGFYNIRFFPNALGLWRILLTYPLHNQAVSLTYDVSTAMAVVSGLRVSFIR